MTNPFYFPETMRTERFILRRPCMTDAEEIFGGYAADTNVTRYLNWRPHQDIMETRQFLKRLNEEWNNHSGFPFMICSKEKPNEIIGNIHAHMNLNRVSFGYVFRRENWGQGSASEALSFLVDHALKHPSIFRTFAFCDVENRASARVMEKAGMKFEGVLQRYYLHPNISNEPRDCLMYARVR